MGEIRERIRVGEDVFLDLGESMCRLLGADAVLVAVGSRAAGEVKLVDLNSFGFSQSDAARARRLYLVDRGVVVNIATAKMMELSHKPGDFAVRRRRDVVSDRAWYGSEFAHIRQTALGLDDAIYGSHITWDSRTLAFGCARAWGARPFTAEDAALADIFWENCIAELAPARSALSRRQRETLRLLLEGYSAKRIASELGLSIYTVNQYIRAVYQAKNVRTRAELLALELHGTRKMTG
ncbi:MAG TPA: helix-turn-helix transcriptional regulator [Polyangiaceae bacterium]|nr:helix-turn-helix transcriptional regulator [Polyangiaceae bacterium]